MTYPGTLLRASQLFAKKELGQNFLADANAAKRIVNLAHITDDDVVLEIGAGLGALTVHSAKQAAKVYAVEKDERLIELLRNELAAAGVSNVEVIHRDIFKVDIEEIARGKFNQNKDVGAGAEDVGQGRGEKTRRKLIVMGNLPYNISSQVLFRLVQKRAFVSRAILMFQKELAQRICAPPGGREYGRLSAVMQYCSHVRTLTDVGAGLFFPKPDVESRVIEVNFFDAVSDAPVSDASFYDGTLPSSLPSSLSSSSFQSSQPHPTLSPERETFLFQVIKAAFSKRRKTLRNSLASSELNIDKIMTEKGLEAAGIDPERRAETLDVKEFIALSEALWLVNDDSTNVDDNDLTNVDDNDLTNVDNNDSTDVGDNDFTDVGDNDFTDVGDNDFTDVGDKESTDAIDNDSKDTGNSDPTDSD
ncbi:MAG: ribosomal RNA small subunit methyltransferase A [Desulfamplus sp.]|nr:ribosomal RNA small subunit methyltransferase A [Desulfamplus sp.]